MSPIRNEYRAKLRNGNELTFWIETSEHQGLPLAADSLPQTTAADQQQLYSYTVSKLHLFNTTALFDHDQLTCVSLSELEDFGPPVQSTVIFRRECKSPESPATS